MSMTETRSLWRSWGRRDKTPTVVLEPKTRAIRGRIKGEQINSGIGEEHFKFGREGYGDVLRSLLSSAFA